MIKEYKKFCKIFEMNNDERLSLMYKIMDTVYRDDDPSYDASNWDHLNSLTDDDLERTYSSYVDYEDDNYDDGYGEYDDYDDYDDYDHDFQDDEEEMNYGKTLVSEINFEKLNNLGLNDYKDIVIKTLEWFEKQISSISNTYGNDVIPPLDDIKDYIISQIGSDYKQYINDDELDNLSRFIYQEIDHYIFD